MSKKPRAKPVPGHACKGAKLYVSVHCECGWTSGKWGAPGGGRASAYGEWKWHVERCLKAQNAAAVDPPGAE